MSGCCEDHTKNAGGKKIKPIVNNEEPKSFIGKYLYKIGKKEAMKGKINGQKNCC